jgi:hypothetical protein
MEYLHPSIATRIIDNSIIFLAAQGLTNLYAVITSEKGKDNVIQYMTSPTEYLFEYGNPNLGKYGQQNNNVYQWLNTSGGAYILRVLPPDAKLANIVYELRYLEAKGSNNTDSSLYIKPSMTTVKAAVNSDMVSSYLSGEIDADGNLISGHIIPDDADGFSVARVVAFVPKARGVYYNNLGVRLTINDALDSTYGFRIFNAEVVEKFVGGGYSVVEGPYLVSFSPDAMSLGQESLYIESVLKKYSKYFDAIVNQSALEEIATVLGSFNTLTFPGIFGEVNPDLIDVVTGTPQNKVNGACYTTACKSIVNIDQTAVLSAGATISITLKVPDAQPEIVTITGVAQGSTGSTESADKIAKALAVAVDKLSNYDGTVPVGKSNTVAILNADARESFQVISCRVSDPALQSLISITTAHPIVNFVDPSSLEVIGEKKANGSKKTFAEIQAEYQIPDAISGFLTEVVSATDINFLKSGTDGTIYKEGNPDLGQYTLDQLIARGFGAGGYTDARAINKKEIVIDIVMDANYSDTIKNAIVTFASELRGDCFCIIDTKFTSTPQQALDWRKANPFSTFYAAIFTQDFVVDDSFSGSEIKVTSTYFLASKIPNTDEQFGIHWPFVGPRRGTISGFKKLSWNPTEPEKELLYKRQINYVEADVKRTKFGTQLTSQTVVSALSNINAVRTLLRIKRDVEELAEDYQFEFTDNETYSAFQYNLNGYLQRWTANRACTSIKGQVYASAYDRQQKIARVRIDLTFNYVIERIFIDLVVNR